MRILAVANRAFETTGFYGAELPCIWSPDRDETSTLPPLGFGQLALRAIWIPDGEEGLRPGYPWIEVGRMVLPADAADAEVPADSVALPGRDGALGASSPGINGLTAAPRSHVAASPADGAGRTSPACRRHFSGYRCRHACVERVVYSGRDAGGAEGRVCGKPCGEALGKTGGGATCPPDKAQFFTNFSINQDMAKRLNTDVDFIMALSAHESAWLGPHAQDLHDLFGVTQAGRNNLQWGSYQASADYWVSFVQGARTMDEFIADLRRIHYNMVDPGYDVKLTNAYDLRVPLIHHTGPNIP